MTAPDSRRPNSPNSPNDNAVYDAHYDERPRRNFAPILFAFALGAAAFYGYATYGHKFITPETVPVAAPAEDPKFVALEAKLRKLSKQLQASEEKLDRVTGEMTALGQSKQQTETQWQEKFTKLESIAGSGADPEAVKQLTEKLSTISTELQTLKTDQSNQANSQSQTVLALQQLDQLETALREGKPFDVPLAKLKSFAPTLDADSYDYLEAQAKQGIVSEADLLANFKEMAAIAVPQGIMANQKRTVGDEFRARIAHMISIRKVGEEQTGDTDEARIARAEAALELGRVEMAIKQLDQLSEAAALPFAEWAQNALNYHESWEALNRLRRTLYGLPPIEPEMPDVMEEEAAPADAVDEDSNHAVDDPEMIVPQKHFLQPAPAPATEPEVVPAPKVKAQPQPEAQPAPEEAVPEEPLPQETLPGEEMPSTESTPHFSPDTTFLMPAPISEEVS